MGLFPLQIRAVFRDGKFVPQEPCKLPNDAEVQLTVDSPRYVPPTVTDPAARAKAIAEIVAAMKANPIPADAPKFTRDELHERR